MSRLEELLNELCPDGVEYKRVIEVATVSRGKRVTKRDLQGDGEFPVYQNSLTPLGYYEQSNYPKDTTFVICAGAAGEIGYSETDYWGADDCFSILCHEYVESRFIYHYLLNVQHYIKSNVRKASIPRLAHEIIDNLKIPVPPLEVQREIVRILDNFTLLTAELTAELTAREKQYIYYRDALLKLEDTPRKTIEEIAVDIFRGSGIKRDEVTESGIPCVRYGEIYTAYDISFFECISHTSENVVKKPKYFEYGDIIFAITGESVEEIAKSIVYLGNEKCMAGGDTVVLKHNMDPRFLSYALSTTSAQKQKSKGKVKSKVVHSSIPAIKAIEIPVPPMEVQTEIADLLDNFHYLINDITSGIPAEIDARQKQYEYYRDKLLTFKRLS